jgi:hypothetical protein
MHRALWRVREFYANSELLGKSPSRIAFVLCREVQRGKFLRGIAQVRRKEYDKVAKRRGRTAYLRIAAACVGWDCLRAKIGAELPRG